MNWTLKEDDNPKFIEYFLSNLSKKDKNIFTQLSNLAIKNTYNQKNTFSLFNFNDYMIFVESFVEDNPKYRNDNFIMQYITPFYNFIIEGMLRKKEKNVLLGFYDFYDISNLNMDTDLFHENLSSVYHNKIKSLKYSNHFIPFDKIFFEYNNLNFLRLTSKEKELIILNHY